MSATPNFGGAESLPNLTRHEGPPSGKSPGALRSLAQPRVEKLRQMTPVEVSLLAGFFIYAALFIYKSSFTIEGVRYFSLFDDDMISMRYAANLAHHNGLVWNPGGGRVLGFTNLLWVLYMAMFHLLPIPAPKIALCIQASGVAFLGLSLIFVKGIAQKISAQSRSAAAVAMCLTGFYGPLVNWSVQGTEVSVLTLAVTASVWLALRALDTDAVPYGLYALLGLSTVCRIDMAVFAGSVLLSLAMLQPREWKRHLILGGSFILAFLIAQLGFNLLYYGNCLPNTYYLKMTGYPLWGRLAHGALVGFLFVLPFLPLLWLLIKRVPRAGISPGQIIIAAAVAAQLSYSVWVGGDAWEWWGGANRYVAIVMPLFFVLLAEALVRVSRLAGVVSDGMPSWMKNPRLILAALVVNALLLGDINRLPSYFLLEKPLETSGNVEAVRQALLVRSLTDKDASIAVVWAGALPYFAQRRAIDLLGKSDEKIAKEPMRLNSELGRTHGFWPGHLKWDYAYSIGQLKPDVVMQLWGVQPGELPWLSSEYQAVMVGGYRWYVKRGSAHFRWEAAAPFHREPPAEGARYVAPIVYAFGILIILATAFAFQRADPTDPSPRVRIATAIGTPR